ncbi:MAG: hypothetical protein WDM90_24765 [Ferruginibacter sp.]
MQISDSSILATIKIHRNKSGILKWKPAIILFDSRLIRFFPNDTMEYRIKSGTTTLFINNKKLLTFEVLPGDTKEFFIKEATSDWRFYLKYGILFLLTLLVLIFFTTDVIDGKKYSGGIIALVFTFWAMSEIGNEYFYVEEQ